MTPPLKVRHLPRYGQLARLLVAHRNALGDAGPGAERDAAELVEALESLGPTFVKLGQLLSGRVDLLPETYTSALSRLCDQAEPMPADIVQRTVEAELGVRVSKAFASFDERPIGAASLAQVHRATMRDGRLVAVKVQRPGVREQVVDDMDVVYELAATFDEHVGAAERAGLSAMAAEFRRALLNELDYRQEAANLRLFARLLQPYDRLFVPTGIVDFSTERVLTMTLVRGRSVGKLSALSALELDGAELAGQLFKAYLDQVLVHGVFHADPHPGNVLLGDDGRLALIDLGMVARVAPSLQDAILRLLVALADGKGADVAGALERAGERLAGFDRDGLVRDVVARVALVDSGQLSELQVGRQLALLARLAVDHGLRPAPELTLLGKTLLNLDDVARRLAPSYEPVTAVREHTAHLMRQRVLHVASPSNMVAAALEAKELAEEMPRRVNKVLDSLAEGNFRLNIEGIDEAEIMRSVQKLANRSAGGLAVAAFVLAAAIFSVPSTGPRWFGVSAFTVVFLGLAALLGTGIVFATLRNDLPQRRRARRRA